LALAFGRIVSLPLQVGDRRNVRVEFPVTPEFGVAIGCRKQPDVELVCAGDSIGAVDVATDLVDAPAVAVVAVEVGSVLHKAA
jgi:hypothetical protein